MTTRPRTPRLRKVQALRIGKELFSQALASEAGVFIGGGAFIGMLVRPEYAAAWTIRAGGFQLVHAFADRLITNHDHTGIVRCLRASDGHTEWLREVEDGGCWPTNPGLVVTDGSNSVVLDPASGNALSTLQDAVPQYADGDVLVAARPRDGFLTAHDLRTGEVTASLSGRTPPWLGAIRLGIAGEHLFIADVRGVHAFSLRVLTDRWFTALPAQVHTMVVSTAHVACATFGGDVACLRSDSGEIAWVRGSSELGLHIPHVFGWYKGGLVCSAGVGGVIQVRHTETGDRLMEYKGPKALFHVAPQTEEIVSLLQHGRLEILR